MNNKPLSYSLVALALISATSQAQAAGFKLFEQSTSAMGNAYAGRGAQLTDASIGYTNPAALIKLEKSQFSAGLNLVNVDGKFTNASATSAKGLPVSGKGSDSLGGISAIPHFHYVNQINDQFAVGFSVAVPFGTSSEYENDFVGRYFAQQTEFQILAFQPSVSYQLNDKLSIGGAIALNYASGTLSKYKDHSSLCEIGAGINPSYSMLSGGAFSDVAHSAYCDSLYEVSGDDIQPSYTLGLHYQVNDNINLALSYHSAVNYTLEGDSTINNTPITGEFVPYTQHPEQYWIAPTIPEMGVYGAKMPVVDLTTGKLAVSPAKTERSSLGLDTPQSLILSVDSKINDALSLQFSGTWTQWSKFTDISVLSEDTTPSISASTSQPQNLNKAGYIGYIPEYWSDVWAFALGATYQLDTHWTLKSGIARDFSPVNPDYRSARIPANNRTWLTAGANYLSDNKWSIDFAGGLMFMEETSVIDHEYNAQGQKIYNSSYQADYDINAYVVSIQFNYPLQVHTTVDGAPAPSQLHNSTSFILSLRYYLSKT